MRAGEWELRALVLLHSERRRQEALDGVARRAVALELAGVWVAMTAAALIEARELQRPPLRVAGVAFRVAMRAAQGEARLVVIERRDIGEARRVVTALARVAEAAFVGVGVTAVAGEGEAAQFSADVALRAPRLHVLAGQREARAVVIEVRDGAERACRMATLA